MHCASHSYEIGLHVQASFRSQSGRVDPDVGCQCGIFPAAGCRPGLLLFILSTRPMVISTLARNYSIVGIQH